MKSEQSWWQILLILLDWSLDEPSRILSHTVISSRRRHIRPWDDLDERLLCHERSMLQTLLGQYFLVFSEVLMRIWSLQKRSPGEALTPEYRQYVRQTIANARQMAKVFVEDGVRVISWGTDNHLLLIDVAQSFGIGGREAEKILETIGISCNKNTIPFDTRKPLDPSGVRLGTPAITTRGMKEWDVTKVADIIIEALRYPYDESRQMSLRLQVGDLCERFPIYQS